MLHRQSQHWPFAWSCVSKKIDKTLLATQMAAMNQVSLDRIFVSVQVSIDGLRSVPLEILKRLETVPEAYLQELGHDHHLFAELPVAVQRQVSLLISQNDCQNKRTCRKC